jgi:hypothetical protein
MKWALGEGVSLFAAPTHEANGMARDPQGRLIVCEHVVQLVTRLEKACYRFRSPLAAAVGLPGLAPC